MLIYALNAQRAAVLEFKANVGVSQQDVDGISAIFITYFQPAGYTMVERTQIDKVIDEQGFQRSKLTENQMVKIGRILNVSKIVVGDVNVVMGQYNVDVRVINVESGTIAATEGATFTGSSYRTSMQSIAQKLAAKIAINKGPTVVSQQPQQSKTQQLNTVITLYGYLHVFPNDLGTFDSKPTTIIDKINEGEQYGYCTWRIPTQEELSLLQSNNIIPSGVNYISTKGSYSGKVRLVTDEDICSAIKAKNAAEQKQQRMAIEKAKKEEEEREAKRVFSVNSNNVVIFSKGNLQYQASTNTWRFAENQWDYIGDANINISSTYSNWIDLFGWGTGNCPTKSSTVTEDYTSFYDWGNNDISNASDKNWRTLTADEWYYIFYSRETSSGIRYAKATVNGVCGVILLPDKWDNSIFNLSNVNNTEESYSDNIINKSVWIEKFDSSGAVFLPAAGVRVGTMMYHVGYEGKYWSTTITKRDRLTDSAYFRSDYLGLSYSVSEAGLSVRLVYPVE